MNTLLKIEEAGQLVLGIYLFSLLNISWWVFLIFFLAPDVGLIGYLINPKLGAVTYNLTHHKGMAILVYLLGIFVGNSILQCIGVICFAHSSFDRVLAYGLKYPDSFKNTHLGVIGNKN